MSAAYRHRQLGRFVAVLNGVILVVLLAALVWSGQAGIVIATAVSLLLAVVFTTLTTEVAEGEFRFWFGPGVWRKRIPLADIAAATVTTCAFWEGIGIRITVRGMLYNVAVGPAVEIRRRSGERFRVGTDDPHGLLAALGAPGSGESGRPAPDEPARAGR